MKKTPAKPDFSPPAHLSESSKQLWSAVVPSRARSPGRVACVCAALEARDRAEQARLLIAEQGLTTTTLTTGAVHLHPLVKVEREARAQFASIWSSCNLEWDPAIDGARLPWNDAETTDDIP